MTFERVRSKLIELVQELAPSTEPGVMLAALENVTLQAKHAYLHALAGSRVQVDGGKALPKPRGRNLTAYENPTKSKEIG